MQQTLEANLLKVWSEPQHLWPFYPNKTALHRIFHFTVSGDLLEGYGASRSNPDRCQ